MLLLRGGRLLDPSQGLDSVGDLLISDGKIERVGAGVGDSVHGGEVRVIDAKGKWVCPGFIDMHVHLREPGHEHKETISSGLRAAAAGGFTAVCPMPNTNPVNDNPTVTAFMLQKAAEAGGARLLPFAAMTRGQRGEELSEMAQLKQAGAVGVSDDGRCVMNAAVMRRVMEYARTFDLLVSQHCEDHHLTEGAQMNEGAVSTELGLRGWPNAAEDIIVARDLILAELTGARYHVAHISTAGAVRMLREAKSRGLKVSAEVTPHHLLLTDKKLLGYDTCCKVNPPLRSEKDREAMVQALADGTIDCIATDHAPHSPLEKDCAFEAAAVGINGLEAALANTLSLVHEGALNPLRWVESLSTSPARVLALKDVGSLKAGSVADVTVIDPDTRWTLRAADMESHSHNSPWMEQEMRGRAILTIVGGRTIYEAS